MPKAICTPTTTPRRPPVAPLTPTRRATLLGTLTAAFATFISPVIAGATAAGSDADLLRLLAEADQVNWAYQAAILPSDQTPPDERVRLRRVLSDLRDRHSMLLAQAAALPAVTAEGVLAKAAAVRDWLAVTPELGRLPHWASADEKLAWSFVEDVVRQHSAAPARPTVEAPLLDLTMTEDVA